MFKPLKTSIRTWSSDKYPKTLGLLRMLGCWSTERRQQARDCVERIICRNLAADKKLESDALRIYNEFVCYMPLEKWMSVDFRNEVFCLLSVIGCGRKNSFYPTLLWTTKEVATHVFCQFSDTFPHIVFIAKSPNWWSLAMWINSNCPIAWV